MGHISFYDIRHHCRVDISLAFSKGEYGRTCGRT